jgi:hypothetical protein
MSKYSPLGDYLRDRHATEVPMTFAEIEHVIGARLPPKAQGHRAWWSNNPNNNVMTRVWLDAGFETERVDMASRRLVFRRVTDRTPPRQPAAVPAPGGAAPAHPIFGAMKGMLRFAPGLDLTHPADPDWGRD